MAFLSNPGLIDGINYFKVALGIVLMSILAPLLVYQLFTKGQHYLSVVFFVCVIVLFFLVSSDGKDDYRDVFGAPGRANGVLSAIIFGYFILFGIFLFQTSQVHYVMEALRVCSVGISLAILSADFFVSFENSLLASWNLGSKSFSENSNLIAPLIGMGLVLEIQKAIKRYNFKSLLFISVQLFALIELRLLQSFLTVFVALLLVWVVTKNRKMSPLLLTCAITLSYVIGVWITHYSIFRNDPSIQERRAILLQFGSLLKETTLLPSNIEALSDFTRAYDSSQIVDDFHNVIYQVVFSYGWLLGVIFIFLTLKPFWAFSADQSLRVLLLPAYTVFFISLLVGIASPNYMYFGATLIGIALSSMRSGVNPKRDLGRHKKILLIFMISPIVFWPAAMQIIDYSERTYLSNLISKGGPSEQNRGKIIDAIEHLPDAGYGYIVARNFYVIRDCKRGNQVLGYMQQLNPRETRIQKLLDLKNSCK